MNIGRNHSPKTEKKKKKKKKKQKNNKNKKKKNNKKKKTTKKKKKKKKKGQKQYNIKHKTKKCLTVSMLYAKSPKKGK